MPFAITGAKYASASISAIGTTTVQVGTAPFVQNDFTLQRLVGLWSSAGVFKGMSWVRRFVSTSRLELERSFFDPATGVEAPQIVGDQVLVSKNFTESVVAGLAVSGRVVSITDTCTFGVAGNQMGVCFYDENKLINATASALLSGGLVVLGKLDSYAQNSISAAVDFQSNNINPLLCTNAAVNFCGYGGRWASSSAPAYWIGGNNQGTAGNTVVLNGVETSNDLLTNAAGGFWARNPERHQLVNCYSITASFNAIMRRWGNGVIRGGQFKFPNNASTPISVFGSDAAGTYTVAADANDRAVVLDMGSGPALVRSSSPVAITFNFKNLITTDFRSVTGSAGNLPANPNGTNTFRFSDAYTGLQSGTVGVILNNAGAVADSVASSGASWAPSLLRRTCVGATVTVNETSWTYGIKRYGYQPVIGTIAPSVYDLGPAGQADNVTFGGAVNQLADAGVTLSQSAALALSSKFAAVATGNGTLTVTANATYDEIYDYLIAWGVSSVALAQFPSISAYPISFAGSALNTAMDIIVNAGVVLSAGAKFKTLATTATVTNNGTISAPYTDANTAGAISVTGPGAADTAEMRKASDNTLIATRTGPGSFAVSPSNVGASVYFRRMVGAELVMSTVTTPVTLAAGANPDVPLFAGAQVQVAQAARLDLLPTLPQIEASAILAKQSAFTGLATAQNVSAAQTAIIAEVDQIPVDTLLTTDPRMVHLDAAISTRLATADYTTSATSSQIADEIMARLTATTIPVDTRKMNGALIQGDGSSGNLWRGA